MAETKDPVKLNKNALDALQKARVEVRDQLVSYRQDLSPASIIRSAWRKKPGLVIAGVTGFGILIGGWMVRPKRNMPLHEVQYLATEAARKSVLANSHKPASTSAPLAFLAPWAALAGKSALPLIGRTMLAHFQNRTISPAEAHPPRRDEWKPGEEE